MIENADAHVARAVAGDKDALEAIVVALQDDLYRLSLRMLGSPSDAQDATQEILIQVITHLGGFRHESSLRTWAWRIATRHLMRTRGGGARQRIAYIVSEIFGLTSADAAAVLDIGAATFRKRLKRARAQLAEFMAKK